jgi:endo-1,4-beta-D-glucanase Y
VPCGSQPPADAEIDAFQRTLEAQDFGLFGAQLASEASAFMTMTNWIGGNLQRNLAGSYRG